jgi:hypothetical protein
MVELSAAVQQLATHVQNLGREYEERLQLRYEIATWASYFLYALGWGLGLAGRLVGVGGLGEGGD